MNNYRNIIKAPIITEKSSNLAANNVITFSVDANNTITFSVILEQIKHKLNKQLKIFSM